MSGEPFKRGDALRFSRQLLTEGALVLKYHAKERMKERRLTTTDLEDIIEVGRINREGEQHGDRWTYVIETFQMATVVAFPCDAVGEPSELVIVSAWSKS